MAAEIYVAVRAIGLHATPAGAVRRGHALSAIGFSPVAGLTVALVRRARQVLVLVAGIAVLVFSGGLSTSYRGLET